MKVKQEIRSAVTAFLAIAALYFFFHLVGIGCPIRFLTGVSCPGCGMTRAAAALVSFRFSDAFRFHPLVYLLPPCAAVFLLQKRIPRKVYRKLVFTIIMLYVIVYTIRMIDPANDIVTFRPEQGFVFRTIHQMIH